MKHKSVVVIFARLPQRGKVKTRLAKSIGTAKALALHNACLQSTAGLVAALPRNIVKQIYFTGSPAAARRAAGRLLLPATLTVCAQRGRPLGARLANALTELLDEGYNRVIFLGSDSPTLPKEFILRAIKALDRKEVVIGPAQDGGYYLIGTRNNFPEMFRKIPWGTERVFHQTLSNLRRARRRIALLPEWYDVDRLEDLKHLQNDVRRSRARRLSPIRTWLREHGL